MKPSGLSTKNDQKFDARCYTKCRQHADQKLTEAVQGLTLCLLQAGQKAEVEVDARQAADAFGADEAEQQGCLYIPPCFLHLTFI